MKAGKWAVLIAAFSVVSVNSVFGQGVRVWELSEGSKVEDREGWKPAGAGSALRFGAAVENDLVLVMLVPGSDGPRLISRSKDVRSEAEMIVGTGGDGTKIGKVQVVKSEEDEAVVQVALGAAEAGVRLRTGQPFVEVSPGKGADAVTVKSRMRYVVLPDFFGYDTAYDPARVKAAALMIPAENFLLGMQEGGDAIMMGVWQGALSLGKKPEDGAKDAKEPAVSLGLTGEGDARRVEQVRIEFAGKPVYVALLAGKGIWHEEDVSGWEAQKPTELAWKRPFEAKWRVNFLGKEGAWSKDLFARNISNDVIFRDTPVKWVGEIPTQSLQGLWPYFICPAWVNKEKTFVALYSDMSERKGAEAKNRAEQAAAKKEAREPKTFYPANIFERLIVYPIDRYKGTPLAEFTPTDVIRLALGVGPCEYVLDLEGVKPRPGGGTRETLGATCGIWDNHLRFFVDAVTGRDTYYKHNEKRLMGLKAGEKLSPEMEQRLVQTLEDLGLFVTAVNERIHEYQDFAGTVAAFCGEEAAKSPQVKPLADSILEKAKAFQGRCAGATQSMDKQRKDWADLLAKIIEEVKAGNYANIGKGGGIRNYAESQDVFISFARRYVKAMREDTSAVESTDPVVVQFAAKIRSMCHDVLRRKHGMEGW